MKTNLFSALDALGILKFFQTPVTYGKWWIRSSIQDYILRNWSIVSTGTTAAQKSLFFNLRRLRAVLNDVGGQGLSPESRAFIAKELAVDEREVEKKKAAVVAALSAEATFSALAHELIEKRET